MGIIVTDVTNMKAIIIQRCALNQSTRASKIVKTLIGTHGDYCVSFLGWNMGSKIELVNNSIIKESLTEIQLRLNSPVGLNIIPFYLIIWWCFIFLTLMSKKWDITYAINLESALPAVIAGRLKGKPVIYDYLDDRIGFIQLSYIMKNMFILLDKISMRLASAVILADNMQVEKIGEIPNSRVVAVYDSPDDIIKASSSDCKENKKFTLFYAGYLSSVRALNLDKAFIAIKGLEGVQLVIAGYGDLVNEIKYLSQEYPEKIQFIGSISHEEVLRRTAKADLLLVLRSHHVLENKYICGSKVLEAMMCGKPILVNKDTSTAKKVQEEDCGLVVNANDIEEIQSAIIKLRDNPALCRKLGENARKAYDERYSWRIMELRLLTLYRELTGRIGQKKTEV